MSLNELRASIEKLADKDKSDFLKRFFKTGSGQYAEGDVFVGLTVPASRSLAKKYHSLSHNDINKLLTSPIHEERLIALFILVDQFNNSTELEKSKIYKFYLKNIKFVNNWDLVDASADKIVGAYLLDKPRQKLFELAMSPQLWERRIAIIATYQFMKVKKETEDTFRVAELLLSDKHDLIHKAVGWMLREAGKIDQSKLVNFLKKHYDQLPRTTLRYAIEHFPESQRHLFLQGKLTEIKL